jgi:hypothetical protein
VRLFAEKTYEKPEPDEAVVVEIDEMWQYLSSKKTNFGSGRLLVAVPVDSLTGNVGNEKWTSPLLNVPSCRAK